MKWTKHHAIWGALLYASLFEFPLTQKEVLLWAISVDGEKWEITEKDLQNIPSSQGYFGIGHTIADLVKKRAMHERSSIKKLALARRALFLLRFIPTVHFLGVSGGVAAGNAEEGDDVDLFIIASHGSVWITRLLVLFVLELIGKRRTATTKNEKDLLCPNMFIDAASLSIESSLYAAHEILQCVPIFERNGVYRRFLTENSWISTYFPRYWEKRMEETNTVVHVRDFQLISAFLRYFEPIARKIEQSIMKSKQTTEIVTPTLLKFHPYDTGVFVKSELERLFKKYNIPLDRRIFIRLK